MEMAIDVLVCWYVDMLVCWCFASACRGLCANSARMTFCAAVTVCNTQRKCRHFILRTSLGQRHAVEIAICTKCARFRAER
jgi:hypothetical protein